MSQFFDGPAPDDLGEEADADPHDLARLAALEGVALGGLLGAQLRVADGVHHLASWRCDSRPKSYSQPSADW